jgi:hypothetical protein
MKNPSLVPTPTTDVNGKQTTVHKRPAGAPKANDRSRAVGAPVPPSSPVEAPGSDMKPSEFYGVIRGVAYAKDEDWALRTEVRDDFNSGKENHRYANHYEDIWEGRNINVLGGRDGWSEKDIRFKLEGVRSLKEQVEDGTVAPNDLVLSTDTNVYTKDDALGWITSMESELEEGLATKGRSLAINAHGAKERHIDLDLGRAMG